MGKKKKKCSISSNTVNSNSTSGLDFNTLQEEIIQHLHLLKESGGLVVGCNTVLKGIENNTLSVVILVSKEVTSAMYHALHLMCKDKDVLFLQSKDIDSKILKTKIPSSTAYGIKKSVLIDEAKFLNFSEKISYAKSYQKNHKQKRIKTDCLEKRNFEPTSKNSFSEEEKDEIDFKAFLHSKHSNASKKKFIGKAEAFIQLGKYSESGNDFPNYDSSDQSHTVSIRIK